MLERQMKEVDRERFLNALEVLATGEKKRAGIGTLSEKTLHAVLKLYYETDFHSTEIKIGNFVADIVNENGITEIQTQSFDKLRKKLEAFLECTNVNLVYPVAETKWLIWIDPETGEITKKRKSPRRGSPYDIFFELYKIKPFLNHPGLRLRIVLLDIEEYRNLDGWSKNRKKGSSRYERIPVDIKGEIVIEKAEDYKKLIPAGLPEPFTSRDYSKASGLNLSSAQTALNILNHLETIKRVGKVGNAYLYEEI